MERTFFIIKPDALKRGLAGQILSRIERRGFQIRDLKMVTATEELISQHYEHLTDKPFFPQLVQYMTSGPMIAGINYRRARSYQILARYDGSYQSSKRPTWDYSWRFCDSAR